MSSSILSLSTKALSADPINASGTLAPGATDFNVGTPFKVGQYISTQIGSVLVFLDGILQTRNTSNSSTNLDGNYYEVDAGSGVGVVIRFNLADPSITRNVLVISNGLLSERPSDSMMAIVTNVQGQLNNLATYVAEVSGNSVSTVLGASPSYVDLQAFGNKVTALESNRARIDQTNTWTAYQPILGKTDGAAVPTGSNVIGEYYLFDWLSPGMPASGVIVNVWSKTLPPGIWSITGGAAISGGSSGVVAAADNYIVVSISSSSGAENAFNRVAATLPPANSAGIRTAMTKQEFLLTQPTTMYITVRHGFSSVGNAVITQDYSCRPSAVRIA